MTKLTVAIREDTATKAAKSLFAVSLQDQYDRVVYLLEDYVRNLYNHFDFENMGLYKKYINFTNNVRFSWNLPSDWNIDGDKFSQICDLKSLFEFSIKFDIPLEADNFYTLDLDKEHKENVEDIIRPFMINYLTARTAYEDVVQVLSGLTTFKQVEEILPELVKYLPVTHRDKINALIPIEQVNRVKALFNKN